MIYNVLAMNQGVYLLALATGKAAQGPPGREVRVYMAYGINAWGSSVFIFNDAHNPKKRGLDKPAHFHTRSAQLMSRNCCIITHTSTSRTHLLRCTPPLVKYNGRNT
jgi:hypothetical protein